MYYIYPNIYIFTFKNYKELAWEPSAATVAKSYSRRLPALENFYKETKFSLLKSSYLT